MCKRQDGNLCSDIIFFRPFVFFVFFVFFVADVTRNKFGESKAALNGEREKIHLVLAQLDVG